LQVFVVTFSEENTLHNRSIISILAFA